MLKIICTTVVGLLLASQNAAAAIPLINGDFEQSSGLISGTPGFRTVGLASSGLGFGAFTAINGWLAIGSVDLVKGGFGAITGTSVDLAGTPTGPGAIVQSFNAVAGQEYKLNWDYFKNGTFGNFFVNVSSIGTTLTNLGTVASLAAFSTTIAPTAITNQSLFFTANSTGLLFVTFATSASLAGGPVVDNITLSAIPEPGEWALMLCGLFTVATIAHRRRSLKTNA